MYEKRNQEARTGSAIPGPGTALGAQSNGRASPHERHLAARRQRFGPLDHLLPGLDQSIQHIERHTAARRRQLIQIGPHLQRNREGGHSQKARTAGSATLKSNRATNELKRFRLHSLGLVNPKSLRQLVEQGAGCLLDSLTRFKSARDRGGTRTAERIRIGRGAQMRPTDTRSGTRHLDAEVRGLPEVRIRDLFR